MASPHSFHERAEPVSNMVGLNLLCPALRVPRSATPRSALRVPRPTRRARAYAFCPLAVSLDSIVNIAS